MSPIDFTDLNAPIIALLGVIVTIVTNYIVQKKKSDTDQYSIERNNLSKEQQEFRKSILDELGECRNTVEKLREENNRLHERSLMEKTDKIKLSEEIISLQKEIITLKQNVETIVRRISSIK